MEVTSPSRQPSWLGSAGPALLPETHTGPGGGPGLRSEGGQGGSAWRLSHVLDHRRHSLSIG